MRVVQLALQHVGGLLDRGARRPRALRLDRLVERARHATATAGDQNEVHAVERIGDPAPRATGPVPPCALPMSRTTTTRGRGHERRALQRGGERGERRQLGRSLGRRTVVVVGRVSRIAPRPPLGPRRCGRRARTNGPRPPSSSSMRRCTSRSRNTGSAPWTKIVLTAAPRWCDSTRAVPRTSCTRMIRQPCIDAVRDRGERLGPPVVDLAAQQLADEALVRRREQQRIAERRVLRALAQEHRALGGRLAEVETGVEHDLLGSQPDRFGPLRPIAQERGDVGDEIVVVRIRIGDARPQPDVGGDHGRRRAWPRPRR